MPAKPELDRRFADFGTVSFTATTQVGEFVDYLKQGQVAGTRCLTCGTSFFPPRAHCATCREKTRMEWAPISGIGALITYSILRYAPVGFEQDLPYAIAVADFGQCKVFGRLGDWDPATVRPGMAVTARVKSLPQGRYTYELVPAEEPK